MNIFKEIKKSVDNACEFMRSLAEPDDMDMIEMDASVPTPSKKEYTINIKTEDINKQTLPLLHVCTINMTDHNWKDIKASINTLKHRNEGYCNVSSDIDEAITTLVKFYDNIIGEEEKNEDI